MENFTPGLGIGFAFSALVYKMRHPELKNPYQ